MTPQQLARICRAALKAHNDSWDGKVYTTELDNCIRTAVAEEGVDALFWFPISLAFHWANDLLAWADGVEAGMEAVGEILAPKPKEKIE